MCMLAAKAPARNKKPHLLASSTSKERLVLKEKIILPLLTTLLFTQVCWYLYLYILINLCRYKVARFFLVQQTKSEKIHKMASKIHTLLP
jgi:1,4-dihydroxy-2-naphthoate octaprenyltransferase